MRLIALSLVKSEHCVQSIDKIVLLFNPNFIIAHLSLKLEGVCKGGYL